MWLYEDAQNDANLPRWLKVSDLLTFESEQNDTAAKRQLVETVPSSGHLR
jgi:hypothetical protein